MKPLSLEQKQVRINVIYTALKKLESVKEMIAGDFSKSLKDTKIPDFIVNVLKDNHIITTTHIGERVHMTTYTSTVEVNMEMAKKAFSKGLEAKRNVSNNSYHRKVGNIPVQNSKEESLRGRPKPILVKSFDQLKGAVQSKMDLNVPKEEYTQKPVLAEVCQKSSPQERFLAGVKQLKDQFEKEMSTCKVTIEAKFHYEVVKSI